MGSHQVSMHKNLDVFNKRISKTYNATEATAPVFIFDENTIKKTIVACMLICKASESDTLYFALFSG
jgi:hypothetical protein